MNARRTGGVCFKVNSVAFAARRCLIRERVLPDYIGFVFARVAGDGGTRTAAVSMRTRPADPGGRVFWTNGRAGGAAAGQRVRFDVVQLHGHEDENYLAALRRLNDKPVIQAFGSSRQRSWRLLFFPLRTCSCWTTRGRNGRSI
jgi:hypothetical protein